MAGCGLSGAVLKIRPESHRFGDVYVALGRILEFNDGDESIQGFAIYKISLIQELRDSPSVADDEGFSIALGFERATAFPTFEDVGIRELAANIEVVWTVFHAH